LGHPKQLTRASQYVVVTLWYTAALYSRAVKLSRSCRTTVVPFASVTLIVPVIISVQSFQSVSQSKSTTDCMTRDMGSRHFPVRLLYVSLKTSSKTTTVSLFERTRGGNPFMVNPRNPLLSVASLVQTVLIERFSSSTETSSSVTSG